MDSSHSEVAAWLSQPIVPRGSVRTEHDIFVDRSENGRVLSSWQVGSSVVKLLDAGTVRRLNLQSLSEVRPNPSSGILHELLPHHQIDFLDLSAACTIATVGEEIEHLAPSQQAFQGRPLPPDSWAVKSWTLSNDGTLVAIQREYGRRPAFPHAPPGSTGFGETIWSSPLVEIWRVADGAAVLTTTVGWTSTSSSEDHIDVIGFTEHNRHIVLTSEKWGWYFWDVATGEVDLEASRRLRIIPEIQDPTDELPSDPVARTYRRYGLPFDTRRPRLTVKGQLLGRMAAQDPPPPWSIDASDSENDYANRQRRRYGNYQAVRAELSDIAQDPFLRQKVRWTTNRWLWSPDWSIIAKGPSEKEPIVKLCDTVTADLIVTVEVEPLALQYGWGGLEFAPDSRLLLIRFGNEVAELWDVRAGRRVQILSGRGPGDWPLWFSPSGSLLVSTGMDGLTGREWMKIWSGTTGRLLANQPISGRAWAFTIDESALVVNADWRFWEVWGPQRPCPQ